MRVLQVVRTLAAHSGGVASAVVSLSEEMARQGHAVEIASLDAPGASIGTGLTTHLLGPGPEGYGRSPRLVPWLRENRQRFDAVIVNGLWQYPGLAVHRALAGTATPYFVFPHGMLDPWFKRTYPLKHLKKWFYWPWAEYRVLRDARAVLFTAAAERDEARESFWLYRCREKILPLGVPAPPVGSAEEFCQRFPGNARAQVDPLSWAIAPQKRLRPPA